MRPTRLVWKLCNDNAASLMIIATNLFNPSTFQFNIFGMVESVMPVLSLPDCNLMEKDN